MESYLGPQCGPTCPGTLQPLWDKISGGTEHLPARQPGAAQGTELKPGARTLHLHLQIRQTALSPHKPQ